jgi:hypothetical protein
MKNFNKLIGSLLLGIGLVAFVGHDGIASVGVRSPKEGAEVAFTTAVSSITSFTVLESTSGIMKGGAIYQLILSTGVAGDFLLLFDTNSALGNASAGVGNNVQNADQLGPRYMYSSTTANTVITFDPPLLFENGLFAINSGATESAEIIYEVGRSLSGQ